VDTLATLAYKEEKLPKGYIAYKISLTGLKGGHSGLDIHLGRGNANKIMNKLLMEVDSRYDIRLVSIDGGSLRNAIPRESFVVIALPEHVQDRFTEFVAEFEKIEKDRYNEVDPGLSIKLERAETPEKVIDKYVMEDLFRAIDLCPNGVIAMSKDMEGVVETSTNLAIVKSNGGKIEIGSLQRSAVDEERDKIANVIYDIFHGNGAKARFSGAYPVWKPNPVSPILNIMKDVYNKEWGKVPEVKVIHAGLECGILGSKYPHWDMISFGPTIRNPHSPDEMVNIETVKLFWEYLVATLKEIPKK
jgi:dipeptidase D